MVAMVSGLPRQSKSIAIISMVVVLLAIMVYAVIRPARKKALEHESTLPGKHMH